MNRFNFGGLPEELANLESASAVVMPVPYDSTTSYRCGTREGPLAIINASRFVELYDEETSLDVSERGIATLGELEPVISSPEAMITRVSRLAQPIMEQGKILAMLGGEHSITVGGIKAAKACRPSFSILQFDAHADLRDAYQGSPYSHACTMRRALEYNPIEQVGIRSLSREEASFIAEKGLRPFYAPSVLCNKEKTLEEILSRLLAEVYITIDLDVLDPSIMPAVGTPEPGGLGWYDILYFLKAICLKKRIIGFDVVELSPQPGNIAPDFLAAKLVYKLLSYILGKGQRAKG